MGGVPGGDHGDVGKGAGQQIDQPGVAFQDDIGVLPPEGRQEVPVEEHVADSLVGPDEQPRAARDRLAVPPGLVEGANPVRVLGIAPEPPKIVCAAGAVSLTEAEQRAPDPHLAPVGIARDNPVEDLERLLPAAQFFEDLGAVKQRHGVVRVQPDDAVEDALGVPKQRLPFRHRLGMPRPIEERRGVVVQDQLGLRIETRRLPVVIQLVLVSLQGPQHVAQVDSRRQHARREIEAPVVVLEGIVQRSLVFTDLPHDEVAVGGFLDVEALLGKADCRVGPFPAPGGPMRGC